MPQYEFITDAGEIVEEFMSIAELERRLSKTRKIRLRDGRKATKLVSVPGGPKPGCWPRYSSALGVTPDQIPEAKEDLRRKGVNVDFAPDGDMKIESPEHQSDIYKAWNVHDMDGVRSH